MLLKTEKISRELNQLSVVFRKGTLIEEHAIISALVVKLRSTANSLAKYQRENTQPVIDELLGDNV